MLPSTPAFALNAALHGLNVALLAAALVRMGCGSRAAALGALLFAVHPAQIAVVAAAPGTPTGVTAWLVALILHAGREPGHFSVPRETGLLAAMAVGWLTTPSILLLPLALLVVDRAVRRRSDTRRMLGEKRPMFAAAVLGGVWLFLQTPADPGFAAALQPMQRVALGLDAMGDALGRCLGLRAPTSVSAPLPPPVAPALLAVAAPALGFVLLAVRFPRTRAGLGCFAVAMVGVGVVAQADPFGVAGPTTVVALAGLCWALGAGLGAHSRVALLAGAALVLAGTARTATELRAWTDERTLLAHTTATEPDHWVAHSRLAELLGAAAQPERARDHQLVAVGVQPRSVWSQTGLGDALRATGEEESARLVYENVLQTGWADPDAGPRLGFVLLRIGRDVEATRLLERAAARRPDDPDLQAGLALALARQGDHRAARRHLEAALRTGPSSVDGRFCAAWLLATAPEPELRNPETALRLVRPSDPPRIQDARAAALAGTGRFAEAFATAQDAAAQLDREGWPERAAAVRDRARRYLESREWRDARPSAPGHEVDQDREGEHRRKDDPGHR